MSRYFLWACVAALASMAALAASAQTAPEATVAAGPASRTSASAYVSALQDFQSFKEEKMQPWRQVNDTVGRIGGWRAYAKEAQQPSGHSDAAPAAAQGPQSRETQNRRQP